MAVPWLTAKACVPARVNPCGIFGEKRWHWEKFFSEFFGFPLSVSFHRFSPNSRHPGDEQYVR
jgi:hypothetical protein